MTGAEAADRYAALFGKHGWRKPLAEALDYSGPARITEALSADRVPPIIVVALEFLESTPPRHWPERWAVLRAKFVVPDR